MRLFLLSIILFCIAINPVYSDNADVRNGRQAMSEGYVMYAVKLIQKAAATNDVEAQFLLAQCLERGIGMEADPTKAFQNYRRAAERGFTPAMMSLSRCYRDGTGVQPNAKRTDEWRSRYLKKSTGDKFIGIDELYALAVRHPENFGVTPGVLLTSIVPQTMEIIGQSSASPAVAPMPHRQPPETVPLENAMQLSDIDTDIPVTNSVNSNLFALIIANEIYQDIAPVTNAINDGQSVAQYCLKTLGIPEKNIHLVKDATLNNIRREVNLMRQIAEAYAGEASFIIYYAGHGIPDEKTREAFLLPVDGFSSDMSTCYKLTDFYRSMGEMPSKKTVVILDACFSGAAREGDMLVAARGVALKPKPTTTTGRMVVLSSVTGDETAYSYDEQKHGLFTYFMLKKLKETKGDITLGTLIDYLKTNVMRQSIVINGKSQTPTVTPSPEIAEVWQSWKLNN